jgi:hypothetical protein
LDKSALVALTIKMAEGIEGLGYARFVSYVMLEGKLNDRAIKRYNWQLAWLTEHQNDVRT